MNDERELRASDAERENAVTRLNEAAADGRLTLAEFSERTGQAYAAKTRAELEPLLADLPSGVAMAVDRAAPVQTVPIGAIKRRGRWHLDPVTRMKVTLGPVKLDLSGAELSTPEVDVYVQTWWGSVKVWVPTGVRVRVDGTTTIGTRTIEEGSASGTGPVVRLHVDTVIGTVKVYRV